MTLKCYQVLEFADWQNFHAENKRSHFSTQLVCHKMKLVTYIFTQDSKYVFKDENKFEHRNVLKIRAQLEIFDYRITDVMKKARGSKIKQPTSSRMF